MCSAQFASHGLRPRRVDADRPIAPTRRAAARRCRGARTIPPRAQVAGLSPARTRSCAADSTPIQARLRHQCRCCHAHDTEGLWDARGRPPCRPRPPREATKCAITRRVVLGGSSLRSRRAPFTVMGGASTPSPFRRGPGRVAKGRFRPRSGAAAPGRDPQRVNGSGTRDQLSVRTPLGYAAGSFPTRTVWSSEPLTTRAPSGVTATARTGP
jgi:hypothetical protein